MIAVVVIGLAVLAAVSLALTLAQSRRDRRWVDVDTSDAELVVRPLDLARLWSLRREVRVPLTMIRDIRTGVPRRDVRRGIRTLGTEVPGLVHAGSYRTRKVRSFWLVGRAQTVTVIECPGARFDRLVLELDPETARSLAAGLSRGTAHERQFTPEPPISLRDARDLGGSAR